MDGTPQSMMKKFKEYRIKTEDLIQRLESSMEEFEKTKDPQKLYEGTRDAMRKFADSI